MVLFGSCFIGVLETWFCLGIAAQVPYEAIPKQNHARETIPCEKTTNTLKSTHRT